MTVVRLRRIPIECDAVQWTGHNEDELADFTGGDFQEIGPENRGDDPDKTGAVRESEHNTWVGLRPGDWVLKGPAGHLSRCAAYDLAEDYEVI
jgi:hypothetical protein